MKKYYYSIEPCVWDIESDDSYVIWIYKTKQDKEIGRYLEVIPNRIGDIGCSKESLKYFVKDFIL